MRIRLFGLIGCCSLASLILSPLRRARRATRRCRPPGGCSIISRSIIPAPSRTGGSSASSNMTRCANSRLRSRSGSARCRPHRERAALVAEARARSRRRWRAGRRRPRSSGWRGRWPAGCSPPIRCRSRRRAAPDLARGAQLYAQHCAACHGATGLADTPMARGMEPPPIAFADRARARERSSFALYQVIEQGLEGTAMQSFAALPTADRWALAFHVGRFAYPEALAEQGAPLLGGRSGAARAHPRSRGAGGDHPGSACARVRRGEGRRGHRLSARRSRRARRSAGGAAALAIARDLLGEASPPIGRGDRDAGRRAGAGRLSRRLRAGRGAARRARRRPGRRGRARDGRAARRDRPRRRRPTRSRRGSTRLQALFGRAEAALAPEAASDASTFLGAFAILLREGLEALLIVVAMIGFLSKAERRDMLRWVHAGWIGALVAGVATWWAASHLHHHRRRRPRADRRLRLAARRRDPAVRRRLDARQGAGRRLAGLCPRQARQGAEPRLGLVPVRARLHRRLSRGVRDDHLLRGDGRAGQWRGARRRHRRRRRCCSR